MNSLEILHITSSYGGTEVYYNLYVQLDKLDIKQIIFVPLNSRNKKRVGNQLIDFRTEKSEIFYSTSLRWFHKYLFSQKLKNITYSILQCGIDFSKLKVIHSSTFCLDGAVAYKLWKKFNIPYIVTVRDTDINAYYKKLIWKRSFFLKILLNSKKIVFLSPSYKYRLLNQILPEEISRSIESKTVTIPNGIDRIFLKNRSRKFKLSKQIKLVYTGAIQKRKNLHSVINAIQILRNEGYDITFTIIGKGLKYRRLERQYLKYITTLSKSRKWIQIRDSKPKKILRVLLQEFDIFVMPSITETFGLVYIEALSQGLPVIYSKGQGFDGFFDDGEVGYSIDAGSVKDISEKIVLVIQNYKKLVEKISELNFQEFDWIAIAKKYQHLYQRVE